MPGHPWFKVLADYLLGQGMIVLRTDDRGEGKTTGEYETTTTGDFAKDAVIGKWLTDQKLTAQK